MKEAALTLAAWVISIFKRDTVIVGFGKLPGGKRYAKAFRCGAIVMAPLIMGAAFELLEASLPAQAAAGAAVVTVLGSVPSTESQQNWNPAKVSITPSGAVAFNAANFVTFNFRSYRGGVLQSTFATLATNVAANALAADTEINVPVTAGTVLQAGDTIDCQMVQSGTGVAVPAGCIAKVELN